MRYAVLGVILILMIGMTSIYAEYSDNGVNADNEEELKYKEQPEALVVEDIELSDALTTILESQGLLAIYQEFLVQMNVQTDYVAALEGLIIEGYEATDVMVAYDYLQEDYAPYEQLQRLLDQREDGQSWEAIFIGYKESEGTFVPTNFEQEYLQSLVEVGTLNRDDIMIADHIAYSAEVEPKVIINQRIQGMSVKEICLYYGLIGSEETLPHVSISLDAINRYLDAGYEEDYIAESYVLAQRVNRSVDTIIDRAKKGVTEEAILADYLTNTYRK